MKRFYKMASTKQEPGGYSICLDGKPVKAPSGKILLAPNEALANEMVKEWAAQEELIVPDSMPLTQILTTKIDRVAQERDVMSVAVLKYLDTDLLCYRASDSSELVQMQEDSWDSWLIWFEDKFGEALEMTITLAAVKQPESITQRVLSYIGLIGDDQFTILQLVTSLSGSLVLALAFVEGAISPEEVLTASYVEESHKAILYNEELHGPDPMEEKKKQAMKADLDAAALYLKYIVA